MSVAVRAEREGDGARLVAIGFLFNQRAAGQALEDAEMRLRECLSVDLL